jgi:hypothetical protein
MVTILRWRKENQPNETSWFLICTYEAVWLKAVTWIIWWSGLASFNVLFWKIKQQWFFKCLPKAYYVSGTMLGGEDSDKDWIVIV